MLGHLSCLADRVTLSMPANKKNLNLRRPLTGLLLISTQNVCVILQFFSTHFKNVMHMATTWDYVLSRRTDGRTEQKVVCTFATDTIAINLTIEARAPRVMIRSENRRRCNSFYSFLTGFTQQICTSICKEKVEFSCGLCSIHFVFQYILRVHFFTF